MKEEKKTLYMSPQVETVEIKTQAIICQSQGNRSLSEYKLNEDDFESI